MEQKKKALGRGLEQLFSSEVLDFNSFEDNIMESATAADVLQIPVNEIRPNPYQPRKIFDEVKLQELATSIKTYGVISPILLRKLDTGRYQILAGERRFRASKIAGLNRVPAIVAEFSDKQMMELSIIENIQREELNVIEEAKAYDSLCTKLGLTQEQIDSIKYSFLIY